jgi:preprotein translocase subunit YajC
MATPSPDLQGTLVRLLEQQEQLLQKVSDLQKPSGPSKDKWDKLGALSGLLIAIVGGLFSFLYSYHQSRQDAATQNHQTKLQEIQTVGTFMPYLVGTDDNAKTIALAELKEILGAKSAVLIAERLNSAKVATNAGKPDLVGINFLHQVASSEKPDEQQLAKAALTRVCNNHPDIPACR